ncbi:hypothetical protein C5L31_000566 [Secundilactobacillus malefermentans]|uniref:Enoyl reductase (ER) domain-containing protein n=1 Tax=Secundilactobacillus malefermentans TaxID=176292 RepID=A0A4R5NQF5_9LACO|nr:zinc-binding dehydrogenase [Secundilactobacillus malefermentans]KRM58769.1 alcohol dehydrogenase GroES domain-containing protein [Secundilactobacillus malefermentans DSM 5705 = KCTC 3548]TDG78971.1 hypothetical protein C5L31_000566 [Secundilactobacillus malefermentans]
MKAIVLSTPGDASVLKYQEVDTPEVKPGWSLVKIKGFGLNRSEIFTRNGWSPSVKLPRILGIEGVGEIAETTDPDRLPKGQKVASIMGGMGRAFDGSYAEYALLPNDHIYPVTTNLSWTDFAAVPETYFTAYGSLLNLKLQKNETLLVRGATSGVGVAAVKLAKAMEPTLKIIGTTRNLSKTDKLKSVGFDDVIEDRDNELRTDNKHFDKILELVGALTIVNSMRMVNEDGILCSTGQLGGQWDVKDFSPIGSIPSGAYMTAFSSDSITETKFNDLLALIENNHIDVTPTKTFNLEHTGDAQAFMDSHDSFGKVVVLL